MEQEPREVFPITFFHGEGPVIMGGSDFRPVVSFAGTDADNPTLGDEAGEEVPITSGVSDEDSESQRTTNQKVEKPGTPAPD